MNTLVRTAVLAAFIFVLSCARTSGADVPAAAAADYELIPGHELVLPAAVTLGKIDFILTRSASASASINGKPLAAAVTAGGCRAFLFVLPVDYPRDSVQISVTAGKALEKSLPVVPHENTVKDVSTIVLPDAKAEIGTDKGNQARITEENRRIQKALAARSPQQFTLPFGYPLAEPIVTSAFGKKRNYYDTGKKYLYSSYHLGLDFRAAKGTPVSSAAEGTVLLAAATLVRGNVVYVDHGIGIISAYMHLDQLSVQDGQKVSKGTLLGLAGTTGVSTGVHLHWSVYVNGVNADGRSVVDVAARIASARELLERTGKS